MRVLKKLNIKPGVIFKEFNSFYERVFDVLRSNPFTDYVATVTSANDGKHMEGSLHYVNKAVDIRTNDLSKESWSIYQSYLKDQLGSDFDVILESDHIHVQLSRTGRFKPEYL